AWAVGRPTWRRKADWKSDKERGAGLQPAAEPSRAALEYCIVLLTMLLLSPMSSKPHFCTLLLPGFCLARLAVAGRRPVAGVLLLAAVAAGAASIKDVVGTGFAAAALWWGSVTISTLLALAGCVYGLVSARAPTAVTLPMPSVSDLRRRQAS